MQTKTEAQEVVPIIGSLAKVIEQMELMGFTRHKTKSQLKKYLRGIGASLAKDYSNKYTIDFLNQNKDCYSYDFMKSSWKK